MQTFHIKQWFQQHLRTHGWKWGFACIVLIVLIAISLKYINRTAVTAIVQWVQSLGILGVAVAILFMALLCYLPVPSEIVIIVYMQLFGVIWGILYAWLGAILGALLSLLTVRRIGRPLVEKYLPTEKLEKMDRFVHKRGTIGMLILRFTPFIPFHALNYGFGLVPIRIWPFLWTTALGLAPFDLMLAGGFAGIKEGNIGWGVIGILLFLGLCFAGYILRKKIIAQSE